MSIMNSSASQAATERTMQLVASQIMVVLAMKVMDKNLFFPFCFSLLWDLMHLNPQVSLSSSGSVGAKEHFYSGAAARPRPGVPSAYSLSDSVHDSRLERRSGDGRRHR